MRSCTKNPINYYIIVKKVAEEVIDVLSPRGAITTCAPLLWLYMEGHGNWKVKGERWQEGKIYKISVLWHTDKIKVDKFEVQLQIRPNNSQQ